MTASAKAERDIVQAKLGQSIRRLDGLTRENQIVVTLRNAQQLIKDISRGLADSGAVNQNPGPESATCWLFPDPDLAKSWLYPDPESANPQVGGLFLQRLPTDLDGKSDWEVFMDRTSEHD